MRYVLASTPGKQLYKKRKHMIEPVFGHTRHNRGFTRSCAEADQRRAPNGDY
jgi:hypothetical protein